jgi:hypothetical protein
MFTENLIDQIKALSDGVEPILTHNNYKHLRPPAYTLMAKCLIQLF